MLDQHRKQGGNTIALLQEIQGEFGYVPSGVVDWFAEKLEVPESLIYGVTTFYSQFHLKPRGRNVISVCVGTACHVKGGTKISEKIQSDLGLATDGETTKDGLFTVESVRCIGACSIAPVVTVNDQVYPDMNVNKTTRLVTKMQKERSGEKN